MTTAIETIISNASRAMPTSSTATTALGAIAQQQTKPATVDGVSAVFQVIGNQTTIWPVLEGADNVTGILGLWRWAKARGSGTLWFNTLIGMWNCTAGGTECLGFADSPVLNTERFADTLTEDGVNNTKMQIQVYNPAGDTHPDIPGYILLDQFGSGLLEARFDVGSATSMNLLHSSI